MNMQQQAKQALKSLGCMEHRTKYGFLEWRIQIEGNGYPLLQWEQDMNRTGGRRLGDLKSAAEIMLDDIIMTREHDSEYEEEIEVLKAFVCGWQNPK